MTNDQRNRAINLLTDCAKRTMADASDPKCDPRKMAERNRQQAQLVLEMLKYLPPKTMGPVPGETVVARK